jgi:hypothetical protein
MHGIQSIAQAALGTRAWEYNYLQTGDGHGTKKPTLPGASWSSLAYKERHNTKSTQRRMTSHSKAFEGQQLERMTPLSGMTSARSFRRNWTLFTCSNLLRLPEFLGHLRKWQRFRDEDSPRYGITLSNGARLRMVSALQNSPPLLVADP